MKLKELLNVLEPNTDVTFEIVEETYPSGILAVEILKKYPKAADYAIKELSIGYCTENEKIIPTILVEVTNKQEEVVVPEFIKSTMEQYGSLQEMLTEEYYSDCTDEIDDDTMECWIDDNFDLLCRAWLNKSDNKLKLQFPQSVVDWLGTPLEDDQDELLSYIMRYYWNEDSAYDDTIPSEVGEYLAESLRNVVKLLRAVEGEPYTAAKEPLYQVKLPKRMFNEDGNEMETIYVYLIYDITTDEYDWVGYPFDGKERTTNLTEATIKSADERYLIFKESVEEEE